MFEDDAQKNINNLVIFKGVLIGLILLLICSTLMAMFSFYFFSLEETFFDRILTILNLVIITFIGFYVARRVDKNGYLNGGLTGLFYMIFLILFGVLSMSISVFSIFVFIITGSVIGSIGGIIGKSI